MDFVLQNIFWVALAVVSGGLLLWNNLRSDGGVSPQDAVHLINREHGMVIDVRAPSDFASGHITGARNIPANALESRMGELEKAKNRPIIVYGDGAANVCALLQKSGFEKAIVLAGGLAAWTDADMPLEK